MIIKSLSRKQPSFFQLANYMNRYGRNDGFTLNCWAMGNDPEEVIAEFYENYLCLQDKNRKNGNALYHEIIALPSKVDVAKETQIAILKDLAMSYAEKRANDQLVYAQIHSDETDYIHAHLMISSNAIGAERRKRLSKKSFADIQNELEQLKLKKYGDYFPEKIFEQPAKSNISHAEFEAKKRSGYPTATDVIRNRLASIFPSITSLENLESALIQDNLRLYKRGKTYGVEDLSTDKKYRLKTLGFGDSITILERTTDIEQYLELSKSTEEHLYECE